MFEVLLHPLVALLPIVFWIALAIIAPTKEGASASSSMLGIVKPVGPWNGDGSFTAWANVQERGEFRFYNLVGTFLGAIIALVALLLFGPVGLLVGAWFGPVIMQALLRATAISGIVDYGGHGAEIIAAERASHPVDSEGRSYRELEIARMRRNRDKRGDDVPLMLARYDWLARIIYRLGS